MLQVLRITAFLEGVSFLGLLFIAVPLKYFMDMPTAVKIPGMAHGVLFMAYVLLAIIVGINKKWSFKTFAIVLIASVLPGGTFYADKKVFKA
jgi:integral membrane protein